MTGKVCESGDECVECLNGGCILAKLLDLTVSCVKNLTDVAEDVVGSIQNVTQCGVPPNGQLEGGGGGTHWGIIVGVGLGSVATVAICIGVGFWGIGRYKAYCQRKTEVEFRRLVTSNLQEDRRELNRQWVRAIQHDIDPEIPFPPAADLPGEIRRGDPDPRSFFLRSYDGLIAYFRP